VAALLPIGRLAVGRWAGLIAIVLCLMTGYFYGSWFFTPIGGSQVLLDVLYDWPIRNQPAPLNALVTRSELAEFPHGIRKISFTAEPKSRCRIPWV